MPQGSILGPLLFLLYINDLPQATNFFVRLFADDTFLCAQNKDLVALESQVNFELQKVYNWLASNRLSLNMDKSKFMLISNKKRIIPLSINIHELQLKECNSYKYLGIFIDKNLTWQAHIQHICKKISKASGALSKLRHCVSIDTLINVYYALVHSYLRYGILAWGTSSSTVLKPLKVLSNRVVKIMTFAPFGNVPLNPIFKCLEILDISQIFDQETAKFLFKVKNNLLPCSIGNYFPMREYADNHEFNHEHPPKIVCRLV